MKDDFKKRIVPELRKVFRCPAALWDGAKML